MRHLLKFLGSCLPSRRWNTFRLYNEPRTHFYLTIKLFQLVGGPRWSLSLVQCDVSDPKTEGGAEALPSRGPQLRNGKLT